MRIGYGSATFPLLARPFFTDFQLFRDPIETSLPNFDRSNNKISAHLVFSFDELVKLLQTLYFGEVPLVNEDEK